MIVRLFKNLYGFIFRWLLLSLFKLCFRLEIKGLDNYNALQGMALIIANHVSLLDGALIAACIPETIFFTVDTNRSKEWWIKPFLKFVEFFPLDTLNPWAVRFLIEEIRKQKKILIFPEGKRTRTGALMKIYEGPGVIVEKTKCPILPIHIEGAQYSLFSSNTTDFPRKLFPKVSITILSPINLKFDKSLSGRARRQAARDDIYKIMRNMAFTTHDLNKTLFQSLMEARSLYGGFNEIIEDIERKPINYNQLLLRAFTLGNFMSRTVQTENKIGLLLPNSNTFIISFWAIQVIGCIPVILNYTTGTNIIISCCKATKLKIIYTSRVFMVQIKLQYLISILKKLHITVICLEEVYYEISARDKMIGFLGCLCSNGIYKYLAKSIDPYVPASILFTSGTEGLPKGVALSHQNIQANYYQIIASIDFNRKDSVFSALPLFHSFGLIANMILPLFSGVKTFIYISLLHYRKISELIYDTEPTILFSINTFLRGYGKVAHEHDFHSLKYVFAGAEKLENDTKELWINKFGIKIFEGYGATEASPAICFNTALQNKTQTVGQFLPGIEYKLEEINDVGQRLWIKGPNIMQGYLLLNRPGLIQPPNDKWYDTGDIVTIDTQGFVTIIDRAKRFAKIAGEMISLYFIEKMVTKLWPLFYHAAIALPERRKGEQIIIFTEFNQANRKELAKYFRAQGCSELYIPKNIIYIRKLPRLATGKVDYQQLKKSI